MRLLLDAPFGREAHRALSEAGHDVMFAADVVPEATEDAEILSLALRENRICVTQDDEFKKLDWTPSGERNPGVIVVRVTTLRMRMVAQVLLRFFAGKTHEEFVNAVFVVWGNGYEKRTREGRERVTISLL